MYSNNELTVLSKLFLYKLELSASVVTFLIRKLYSLANPFVLKNGMLRNGGHAGYSLVYGNDWLRDEVNIFLNGVLKF